MSTKRDDQAWQPKRMFCSLFGISPQHFDRSLADRIPADLRRKVKGNRAVQFYAPFVVELRLQDLIEDDLRFARQRTAVLIEAHREVERRKASYIQRIAEAAVTKRGRNRRK